MMPEIYFLRYARPCADFMLQRGEINCSELSKIDCMLYEKISVDREFIERIFYRAILPLKKISKNYWNINTIKQYFHVVHNELIDSCSEGFEHLTGFQKELCRVHEGIVKSVNKDYYEVSCGNETEKVLKGWVNDAKPDDIVFIHYAMAVEKK
ncbi:hypothetical protein COX58_00825 [archaeon CG_4_10_14_0_2_um_filter_Archaea_38_6]|nr:MAG: hypothetical protein COS83_00640 [archaeon CG07_land_8_20_14_0_80_38_8]PIU89203.1 MAG: hypothetical protein COS64_01280 [archaeon CG06_land_8_20_14_3_00_37_11]PJA22924.1 MAG: hypothetical protein COX58_00825 [archaeon CG_4_10_14_0_2_um_filter_Archaea_38_6]